MHDLQQIIEQIKSSGALGRSPVYAKLLNYLAETTAQGSFCSEMSVAVDVFGKDEDFDVTSDSTVRVYIHNLRQKLKSYYEGMGAQDKVRISIPKGAYRLVIDKSPSPTVSDRVSKSPKVYLMRLIVAGLAISMFVNLLLWLYPEKDFSPTQEQRVFWGELLSDDKPVLIVIGDYYIFGEATEDDDMRLVREFDINSAPDLREKLSITSAEASSADTPAQFDLGLTYLPRGSAYALSRVQEILNAADKRPRITMMSEFTAEDMRSNHVIYVGYLSGLSVLESYTFLASRFKIGFSYDEILDSSAGRRYTSNLIDATEDRNFVDYGIISNFSGRDGNQIMVIAGTRDAGLMEMSDLAVDTNVLTLMDLNSNSHQSTIAMFEVYGFNLTNISSVLIGSERLDPELIWGG